MRWVLCIRRGRTQCTRRPSSRVGARLEWSCAFPSATCSPTRAPSSRPTSPWPWAVASQRRSCSARAWDKATSGAAADIKRATQLARAMVTQYGMSDKLGPLAYGDNEEEVFLGHSIARQQNLSDETQTMVDEEIHRIVDEAFEHARKIISEHIDDLHTIAHGLLEYETLS